MSFYSIAKRSFLVRASYAIASLFGNGRKSPTSSTPANVDAPTTKEGTTIPVIFGTRDIKAPILAWYGNTRKESNLYYFSGILVLCYGKIDSLIRLDYGDKLIWSGKNIGFPTDGTIQKNAHFSDGSGLYGNFTFDNGGNYQGVDAFSSQLTGVGMKYDRLSHVILKDVCIGPVSSLRELTARVVGLGIDKEEVEWNPDDSKIYTPEQTFPYFETSRTEIGDWDTKVIAINLDEPNNISIQLDYEFNDVNNPPIGVTYEVAFLFTKGLTSDEIASKISNGDFDYKTIYTGSAYMEGSIVVPGDKVETITGGTGQFKVMRLIRVEAYDPTISTVYIVPKTPALTDLNPAHILYYCITNKTWGMGYTSSDVDSDSFNYAADRLKTENFGLSIKWEKNGSIYDLVQDVLEHINGVLFVDRKTGKFKLNLIRQDYNVALLTLLNSENIESVNNYKRTSSSELCNTVNLSYYDTLLGDSSGVTVSDSAMVAAAGQTIATKVDYPGISNLATAKMKAMDELKAVSAPIDTCTIVANYDAKDLDVGDAFILDYTKYTSAPTVFRVLKISFGDGVSNKITIEASKDVW